MKYKVGDLLTTGLYLYLVVEVNNEHYYVRETERNYLIQWHTKDADGDRHLEKVN